MKDSEITQSMSLAEIERAAIEATLVSTGGNRSEAAKILGIDRRTLYRKLARYHEEDHKNGAQQSGSCVHR